MLDHRVVDQISTRRLRVVKYRGSSHGTNEYPFLIDRHGIAVLPITSLQLIHAAPSERVSSGLDWLDDMLGGKGFFRASSVLLSGGAGAAKTTFAACFVDAACRRGERAVSFQFEESPAQYVRNMRSIGIDLQPCIDAGVLRVCAARATFYGLESHLTQMHRDVEEMKPAIVVVDPISSFTGESTTEVSAMMMRLIDFLKNRNITAMFTHLIPGGASTGNADLGVSSLMDTWIVLRSAPEADGGRQLAILKSRGMAHATSPRAFRLTNQGAMVDGLRR
jgi:circadian clock protein KaiC